MTETVSIEQVKEACKTSLHFLCTQILGFKDWDIVHDDLERTLARPSRRKLILIPRGHLKTTVVTKAYAIQCLLRDPDCRILIANQIWDKAREMLYEIKQLLTDKSDLPKLFGNFLSERWREDDIVISQRRKALAAPSIGTSGVEAELTSSHYDIIFLDDLQGEKNFQTPEQREKVKRYYRSMMDLLEPGGLMIVVGCLVAGTKVLKADGTWKKIEDFEVGEKVVSHDSIETVEAMIPQGHAPVFELKTRNFTIQATANHPFLTKNGFVKLENLKAGDKITALASYDAGGNSVDAEESWALGFMFGDGWITRHPNSKGSMRWVTCFARGIYEELNQKVLSFFKRKFNVIPKLTKFGYYRTEVADVGRYFEKNGLIGNAHTKRVPSWMFSKNVNIKNKFLEGLSDSDGHVDSKNQTSIELCNRNLVEDIKYLATGCGLKTSNIYSRSRFQQAPNSPTMTLAESHHVWIGHKVDEKKWREVEIISITPKGIKEVFDLTVSNTHNFVANGLVVHNTRWHLDDVYQYIIDVEKEYFDITVRRVIEDGRIIFPKKFSKKFNPKTKAWEFSKTQCMDFINFLKKRPSSEFSSQYMNDPIDSENQIFKKDYFKYWEQRPPRLFIAMTIDPAISEKQSADYFAINVSGMDENYNIYVLDTLKGHWKVAESIENIFTMYNKWHPNAVGLETVAYQKALKSWLEEKMREKGNYFPITELKRSTNESKEFRIKSLEPFFKEGKIFFARWMKSLEDEALSFPRGKHDDELDALASQLELLIPGDSVSLPDTPTGSWEEAFLEARKANVKYQDFFHEVING